MIAIEHSVKASTEAIVAWWGSMGIEAAIGAAAPPSGRHGIATPSY